MKLILFPVAMMAAALLAVTGQFDPPSTALAQGSPKSDTGAQETNVAGSAQDAKPLTVNSKAPDITLATVDGKPFKLGEAMKKQPTVLIFYRGGWCPFCNRQLADLRNIEGDLKGLGYQLLAICMDRPEELRKTMDKQHMTYTLLSDSDAKAVKAFGVAFKVDDPTVEKYKGFGIDLEKASGHDHHILPVPSVFIIGTDRTIRFVHSNPDYRVRLAESKVLEAAKTVEGTTSNASPK